MKWKTPDIRTLKQGTDTSSQIEPQLDRHNLNYFGINIHNGVVLDISIACRVNIYNPMEEILRSIHGK
jgi:hypothetical protein